MADDFGDKTEAPTPRRREEAREQGQVAKSTDLVASVCLLFAVLMLGWFGPGISRSFRDVLTDSMASSSVANLQPGSAASLALHCVRIAGIAAAPLVLGCMLVAVMGNVLQVGFNATTASLEPKLDAINPIKGIQRLFGGANTAVQMAMNLLKLLLVGAVGYSAVHSHLGQIVAAQQLDHQQAFGLAAQMVYEIALRVAVVLLVLSVGDYAWKRFKFEQDLKMTKQEIKEEVRRFDGDPHIRQRRRQIALKMLRDMQKKAVPTADVVITNPTEYAVALKYDAATGNAPRVVAKGRGPFAAEIRKLAIQSGVPILERPPLARALYRMCEVGQEIPEEFYTAVAEILAYVYELTGRLRRGREAAA
jgi:flagellar biosynthetic protein FlhB